MFGDGVRVFTRLSNELVNWRRSPAGAEGTNTGHKNGEAMASVGVHVERPVRICVEVKFQPIGFEYDFPAVFSNARMNVSICLIRYSSSKALAANAKDIMLL